MKCRAVVLTLLALALASPSAHAQDLRGILLLPDSTTPASSAIVEAVLVADPAIRIRAMSGARGDFALHLGQPGPWRVTVMRIGFLPMPLGEHTVAAGEVRRERVVLTTGAVRLAQLNVERAALCGRTDDSGELVATLLSQARTALASTMLSTGDGRATSEWQAFSIHTDRLGTPITPMRVERFEGQTDRPFGTVPPDVLATEGYFRDRDDDLHFLAPDAAVLLSERFVDSHCYSLAAKHDEIDSWIGVSFVPAAVRRNITDVKGTLWLDRETSELRRLDFGYVNLPDRLARANPRGRVDFARLPTGVHVVRRWELRMPRVGGVAQASGYATPSPMVEQVNLMHIEGGLVSSVRHGTSKLLTDTSHPADHLPDLTERTRRAPQCADAPRPLPATSGIVYGTLTDSAGRPVRDATVRIHWGQESDWEERVAYAGDGVYVICNVALNTVLRIAPYVGTDRATDEVNVRLNGSRRTMAMHLVVP